MTADFNEKNEIPFFDFDLLQILNLETPLPWGYTNNFPDTHDTLSDELNISLYLDIVLKSEKDQKKKDVLEQLIWKKILCLGDLNLSSPLKALKDINYYEIFDLEKSSSMKEIEGSYLKLIKLWNPSRNNNSQESISNFRLISKIYKTLSNQATREGYDKFLENLEKEDNTSMCFTSKELRIHHRDRNLSSINNSNNIDKPSKEQFVKIFSSSVRRKISRDIERRQNSNRLSVTKMIWNSYLSEQGVFILKFNQRRQLKEANLKYFYSLLLQCQKVIEERLSIYYHCQIKIQNNEECTISCLFNSKNKIKMNEANVIYCNLLRILSFDTFTEQKTMLCIWLISMIPVRTDDDMLIKTKATSIQPDISGNENGYLSEEEVILLRPTSIKV